MGEALFELEQILRSKPENLTSQEVNVLMTCKAKAVRGFTIGAGVGGVVTWLASGRLSNMLRINLSGGAAAIFGFWKFSRAIDSCVEHILELDGSRMQKELANIMLKKYQDDPWVMRLISKHFYSEKVYDDSYSEQPKIRWRYRNYFGDNIAHSQTTRDGGDSHNDNIHSDMESKQDSMMNSGFDVMADPLDCLFGLPARVEEIHHPDTPTTLPGRHSRSHKRSHRRHRTRHPQVSTNSQEVG